MTAKQWCVANRQWKRKANIAHAEFQLRNDTSKLAQAFWAEVLKLYDNSHKGEAND
jgi:hypothetical protein